MAGSLHDAKELDISRSELLRGICESFSSRPAFSRGALRRWAEIAPNELAKLGTKELATRSEDAAHRYLAQLIYSETDYHPHLLDPVWVNNEEALHAAKILCPIDPHFYAHMVTAAEGSKAVERLKRLLYLVEKLNAANVVVPFLRRTMEHPDARLKSRATLICCQLYGNPRMVERQLLSPDARVRANAVEGLWARADEYCRTLLEHAAEDKHHRVAVNAILGLYRINPQVASNRLKAIAAHNDYMFRAAAAWAMGWTGDPAFRKTLEHLQLDEEVNVRSAAGKALQKLRPSETVRINVSVREGLPPEPTELQNQNVPVAEDREEGQNAPRFQIIS